MKLKITMYIDTVILAKKMVLIWSKHGISNVLIIIEYYVILVWLPWKALQWKFESFQTGRSKYMAEIAGPYAFCMSRLENIGVNVTLYG